MTSPQQYAMNHLLGGRNASTSRSKFQISYLNQPPDFPTSSRARLAVPTLIHPMRPIGLLTSRSPFLDRWLRRPVKRIVKQPVIGDFARMASIEIHLPESFLRMARQTVRP